MMVGLQGSGKTTTSGKLANLFRKQGKKPLLVACDIYRPAAIKQLQVVGAQLNIPVYANEQSKDVVHIAKQAINVAMSKLNDVIILDTAGRLQIDEQLMEELQNVKKSVKPHEILLVVDSMTGQEAVNVAETFNEKVGIDGIVLTKLDGDTRGGAALSVKKVTGRPIKFAATGEKMSDIEVFHPDRMASRILGMGDILAVIEKAEEAFDLEEAEKLEKKIPKWIRNKLEETRSVLEYFFHQDKKYVLHLKQDHDHRIILCASSRRIPQYLDQMLWSRGMGAILTSGTLKTGQGFSHIRKMTGITESAESPGICGRLPV